MDEELHLWAIHVDQFRRCFAAPPDLAEKLRQISDSLLSDQVVAQPRGLLSKLGPLVRHPPNGNVIRPGVPTRSDAEALMTSRFIASDRLSASWVLARAWLDELSMAHTTIPLPRTSIDNLEFDLARAGVPTQISIRHLWLRGVDIPLRATTQMSIGHLDYPIVVYLVKEWTTALPELQEDTQHFAKALLGFASAFPQYSQDAIEKDLEPPDLIAWWTSR